MVSNLIWDAWKPDGIEFGLGCVVYTGKARLLRVSKSGKEQLG